MVNTCSHQLAGSFPYGVFSVILFEVGQNCRGFINFLMNPRVSLRSGNVKVIVIGHHITYFKEKANINKTNVTLWVLSTKRHSLYLDILKYDCVCQTKIINTSHGQVNGREAAANSNQEICKIQLLVEASC